MEDKILIVDDDKELRSELKDLLEGYDVIEASDGEEAIKLIKKANQIGLVILDVMMPGMSGLDVLSDLKKTDPELNIIILTGHSSKDVAIEALKGHADDYIEKPVNINKLKNTVEKLMEARRGESDIDALGLKGKIDKVKRFIERNSFKKTTLKDAAEYVYLSPKYLSRVFKDNAGVDFSEYRLKIKAEKAKELLTKTSYNINQVTEKLGYENAESFIRQFKKYTKCTPTEYRKKMQRKTKKKKSRR